MKVSEVMTTGVEVVGPEDSLRAAAEKMKRLDVGPLPVCDGRRVLGMVTDRDIVVRGVAEGLSHDAPVSKVMTPQVEWIFMDQDVTVAAKRMRDEQIRRLIVLDNDKKLVGMLSLGDLSHDAEATLTSRTLEQISEPSGPIGGVH